MEPTKTDFSNYSIDKIVDIIIRLGLLFLLLSWCFSILKPFIFVLIWGAIIAISVYPAYNRLVKLLRGRKVIPSIVVALVMLSVLVIPGWILTESMIGGIGHIQETYQQGQPIIPPPGESVKNWPSITKPVINLWQLTSDNLQEAVIQHKDQLTQVGKWLIPVIGSFGKGIIQFLISIILTAVMLVFSKPLSTSSLKILNKLAPDKGDHFAKLTVSTVRSVVKGILGVSAIQAAMAGTAFFIAGVPYAGLWTLLCLILSIVQVGSWPVLIPMAIYVFTVTNTFAAILFAIWMLVVMSADNFLKPLLMGRDSSVPTLVVFLGSIGGFITMGFLGLFLGAVILSIGYNLFEAWLNSETQSG